MKPRKRHGPPEPKPRPTLASVRAVRAAAALRAAPAEAPLPPRPWRIERKPDGHVIVRDARGATVGFFSSTVINHVIATVNAAARGEETEP